MFTISVRINFNASHRLALPDGSREPLHSHNWLVEAELSCEQLSDMGLVEDFVYVKKLLSQIVAEFDSGTIEQADHFKKTNSSAENLSEYIYNSLKAKLPCPQKLTAVTITEQPGCSAKFFE